MASQTPPNNRGLKFTLLRQIARVTRTRRPRGLIALLRYAYARLLRRFYSMDHRQNDHIAITIDYDDNLLINVDTASFIEWWIFFFDEYEAKTANLIKRLFRQGFVAFDVGANIGAYTLLMADRAGESGRVYAFEPQPEEFQKLVENTSLNRLSNVRLMTCALSDQPGHATLYSYASGFTNRGASSLHPDRVSADARSFSVELSTVDALVQAEGLQRLDFMKVDTEGHDFKVLLGARESLRRFRPHVIFEYHAPYWQQEGFDFSDAERLFEGLNYSLYVVDEGHLTPVRFGRPHASDVLAVPRMVP